jgi:hypothetical protein
MQHDRAGATVDCESANFDGVTRGPGARFDGAAHFRDGGMASCEPADRAGPRPQRFRPRPSARICGAAEGHPKGSYDLNVWKSGYEAPAIAITVDADLAVDVAMKP